jgi:hypothetical protein
MNFTKISRKTKSFEARTGSLFGGITFIDTKHGITERQKVSGDAWHRPYAGQNNCKAHASQDKQDVLESNFEKFFGRIFLRS